MERLDKQMGCFLVQLYLLQTDKPYAQHVVSPNSQRLEYDQDKKDHK